MADLHEGVRSMHAAIEAKHDEPRASALQTAIAGLRVDSVPDGPCLTPGAQFRIHVSGSKVEAVVVLLAVVEISEATAVRLEASVHDALERALEPYFTHRSGSRNKQHSEGRDDG